MTEDIQIPMTVMGKIFYRDSVSKEDVEKYGLQNPLPVALAECQNEGYRAAFIPKIMDMRSVSDKNSFIWNKGYSAPSVRVTGTTKGGSKVVVYAHIDNYFSDPKNIQKAIVDKKNPLINGAGYYPKKLFQQLLNKEDGVNVFVIDYDSLKNSTSGTISISDAMKHPQVIPFIGGEKRAEKYLEQHEKVVGKNIGVYHSTDLHDVPYGRVLFVDNSNDNGNLNGYNLLNYNARFVGVPSSGVASAQKIKSPLETLVGKGIDAGNGIVVIRQDLVSPTVYNMLTRK